MRGLSPKKLLDCGFKFEHGLEDIPSPLDLVTFIPTYIIGPFICPNVPASVHASLAMVLGYSERFCGGVYLSFVRFIFISREREREREMEGDKGKVCVTGGTGFLASWLIMRLLEHGYSVHTTIRPDPGELLFLFSLSTQLR
ncbi:hypothetical protein POTOM_008289 [Populus tomentosa]|uniref:NAD(P)-binding Rossmann-fold superfamily protein n=2 Tax=Populus TaxID=3689 RepID=A0A8X8D431_POPTO|nr:hypothetical protein POTOM_008289 [Populus tomentosa]